MVGGSAAKAARQRRWLGDGSLSAMMFDDNEDSAALALWQERLAAYLDGQEGVDALPSRSQPNPPWPDRDNPMVVSIADSNHAWTTAHTSAERRCRRPASGGRCGAGPLLSDRHRVGRRGRSECDGARYDERSQARRRSAH